MDKRFRKFIRFCWLSEINFWKFYGRTVTHVSISALILILMLVGCAAANPTPARFTPSPTITPNATIDALVEQIEALEAADAVDSDATIAALQAEVNNLQQAGTANAPTTTNAPTQVAVSLTETPVKCGEGEGIETTTKDAVLIFAFPGTPEIGSLSDGVVLYVLGHQQGSPDTVYAYILGSAAKFFFWTSKAYTKITAELCTIEERLEAKVEFNGEPVYAWADDGTFLLAAPDDTSSITILSESDTLIVECLVPQTARTLRVKFGEVTGYVSHAQLGFNDWYLDHTPNYFPVCEDTESTAEPTDEP